MGTNDLEEHHANKEGQEEPTPGEPGDGVESADGAGGDDGVGVIVQSGAATYPVPAGRKAFLGLVGVAAVVNLMLVVSGSETIDVDAVGVAFSLVVILVLVLLALWWAKTAPLPHVEVTNITATVGTPCSPVGAERVVWARGPNGPWTKSDEWVQATAGPRSPTAWAPNGQRVGYAYVEQTRNVTATCQRQVCTATGWANKGAAYPCTIVERRVVQVFGASGQGAGYQGWSSASIDQSISLGYQRPFP